MRGLYTYYIILMLTQFIEETNGKYYLHYTNMKQFRYLSYGQMVILCNQDWCRWVRVGGGGEKERSKISKDIHSSLFTDQNILPEYILM